MWSELERSRRARRPLSAENNLLGCGAHWPPAEVDYPGALRSAQPPPPPPLSVGVPKAAALAFHDCARRGPCAPPALQTLPRSPQLHPLALSPHFPT